jgi:ribosomal protein L15
MGYTKLLATGKLTRPLTIKIASTSKAAITKIKAAGGQIQTETDTQTEEAEEKEEE